MSGSGVSTGGYAQKSRQVISLFSGVGGCALGFKDAGFDVIDASDINQDAIEGFNHNISNVARVEDISKLSGKEILQRNNLKPGDLSAFIGGPPCQGFSSAGGKFWEDPRNTLLKHYLRLMEEVRPRWFLIENVEGLLTSGKGSFIYEVSKKLIELGYSFRIKKIYCHNHGLPQLRKRVFIMGNSMGFDFDFPQEDFVAQGSLRDGSHGIGVEEALNDLSFLNYNREAKISWHDYPKISELNLNRIELLRPGQNMRDLPEELQHPSFTRRANRRVSDGTPTERRGGAPSGMRRLMPDQPSPTITSAATREFIHYKENRFITIREAARLQSFPDSFEFFGTDGSVVQQIGNAIPPMIAKLLAEQIIASEASAVSAKHTGLLSFDLTKSNGVSPALANTLARLGSLQHSLYSHA